MENNCTPIQDSKNAENATLKRPYIVTVLFVLFLDLVFLFIMALWAGKASAKTGGPMPPPMGFGMMGGGKHPEMKPFPPGLPGDGMRLEMMMDGGHPIWRHIRDLGLDEKQKGEIQELRSRVMKEMIRKRADEQIAGMELKDLLEKDPVDMNAVETKLKRIEIIRMEMHLSLIRAVEEVKSKLTPNQRKKLQEMHKTRPGIRERSREEEMMDNRLGRLSPWERGKDEDTAREMGHR
ncbi:MAG: Spy/CpxP family protein refolding chaperone [Deltaproteobacteria bacterium]|nr:Spy/CpxP family protein refolding chaperone [Deltaproteobacteria bacterium]